MADTYKVNSGGANAYEDKNTSSKVTAVFTEGNTVRIYEKSPGANNQQFGNAAESGTGKWIVMDALTKINSSSSGSDQEIGPNAENEEHPEGKTPTGNSDAAYNEMLLRYLHAFGSPPRFTEEVDPYYGLTNDEIQTGRVMMSTWYSQPSILSLCPGTVDYLPGFSKKKKDQFFNRIKSSLGSLAGAAEKDNEMDSNGQLYAFKSSYKKFINVVNLLARTVSLMLGIGDVTNLFYGTNQPLKSFDYGYYTTATGSAKAGGLFAELQRSVSTAVSDNHYIHFFVNHSGASVTENISTTSGASYLEKQFGSDSQFSELAQNLQFLFGGAITPEAQSDIDMIMSEARSQSELIGGMATIANNYLKGGRLVFPKMITGMDYSKAMSVELKFTSIYGDKRSIFKYVILPCLYLLAMATPLQMSSNMYTYPFLVRASNPGNFNSDLAFLQKLDLSRGGDDGTCWTADGLPTEIIARFDVVPLYSNLMVSSATTPFLFMKNTSLLEYLGNMCGVDLKLNNLDAKSDIAFSLIKNRVFDIPTNIARSVVDSKIVNEVRKFTSLTGT